MLKRYFALCLITVLVLPAAACAPQAQTPATPAAGTEEPTELTQIAAEPPVSAELKVLRLSGGASDFGTIDPALATLSAEIQIAEAAFPGVVRQNETTAEIEPAMTVGFQISEDGLTYTVDIMEDVPWVHYNADARQVEVVKDCRGNERTVTAQDFVYGVTRTLDPATASDYSYALLPYLAGASEFNNGTNTEPGFVGVRALSEHTIEYTFKTPAVYNLNLLGLWFAHATPQWLIEGDDCTKAAGIRWTEQQYFQGYGPYTLKGWVHDSNLTLIKNPFWPGTETVPRAKIDEIEFRFLDASPALAEFDAGNLDVTGIPSQEWDRLHADPEYAEMIRPVYTLGTEWYGFNTRLAPTDDQRVRLALSLAIDRERLVQQVVKGGVPAQFFTNPGAAAAPKPDQYPEGGVKYDPEKARELLNDYLTEKNLQPEDLKLTLMANSTEGNRNTGEAIVGMWKKILGIDVAFVTRERAAYLRTRTEGKENIYRNSWVQDYPDANNFLFDVFGLNAAFTDVVDWPINVGLTASEEYTPGSNPSFDRFTRLLQQAASEQDPQGRMDLYAQAEQILLVDEAVVAPLYWYTDDILIRPEIQATESITGYDHWEKWDIQR